MPDIELTSPDGHTFAAYRADYAEGPPRGGVVVIQEIFGVNGHIRSVTDRLAEAGFVAVAPALFDRVERGAELGYDDEGMAKGRALAWDTPLTVPAGGTLTRRVVTAVADGRLGPGEAAALAARTTR